MNAPLVTCSTCARHVRGGTERCPFCDAPLPIERAVAPAARSVLATGVGRLALASAGLVAVAGVVAAACGARYGAPPAPELDA